MAAVDRRNPNLDDFVGLNWSCWVDRVDIEPPDDTKYGRDRCETMTLRKEDMPIYGHCPAQDDFYLVVCSHCGKVVKPQAFEEHCERRHSSPVKVCGQSNAVQHQQPTTCRQPSNVSRDKQKDRSSVPTTTASQRRPSKPQKKSPSLPSVENIPQEKSSSSPRPKSQQVPSRPLLPPVLSHCTPSSSSSSSFGLSLVKPTIQKPTESSSPQRETRTYSRLLKNINKKEQEVSKGPDLDKKKPIHTQIDSARQQKVKTDPDPTLTLPQDAEQPPVKTKATESLGAFSENRCSKFTLNNHTVRSRDASESFPEEDNPVEVEVQPPYPFNQSLPSSDEEHNDEEYNDLSTTSWHPKPLGLCSFGCRAFGCSIFTFDRRLHRLRAALSAMLEEHVNSQQWKKMPPPASNLRSHNATAARPNAPGSLSLNSTSLPQRLQNKNTQNNSRRTKSPPSVSNMNVSPGQHQCSSVGQVGKNRLGQVEHTQNAKNTQKATYGTTSKQRSTNHVSLSRKTPPLSPLRNTSIFNESPNLKSCSKSRPQGTQPKVGSLDDRSVGQKRKSPAPTSSPQSKKCPHLSPPSRSSLFSWKRDSTQDVWLGVWRKEQTSEDDT